MDMELLRSIGLSNNEAEVYLALLALGEASVLEVCEKIHKNRTYVYDLLHSLVEKGLASYSVSDSKRYFRAVTPTHLIDMLGDKEKEIRKQKEEFRKALPELLKLQNTEKKTTKVELYSGKEGIKTVYNEILRSVKSYAILGATGKITEELEFYFPHHERERVRRKIGLKILFNPELRKKEVVMNRKYCSVRFLPGYSSSPLPMLLFGNKIGFIIWDQPSAIVIESKIIGEAYKTYFELLWNLSEK